MDFQDSLRLYLFTPLEYLGLALQLLALILLILGPIRQYFILLIYLIASPAFTAAEMVVSRNGRGTLFNRVYWTGEMVTDLALFLVVIVFIYKAMQDSPFRSAAGKILAAVFVIVIAVPFTVFKGPAWRGGHWFDHTAQLLNFGAAIMILVLWTTILGSKKRDPVLLVLSIGLGLTVTGWAISYGLRELLPKGVLWTIDLFAILANLSATALWCFAFIKAAKSRKATAPALS